MASPTCERFAQCMQDLVEPGGSPPALAPQEEGLLRRHAESCPRCTSLEARYLQTLDGLRGLPRVSAPRDFGDGIHRALRGETPARPIRRWRVGQPLGVAAAAVVVVGVALGILLRESPQEFLGARSGESPGRVQRPEASETAPEALELDREASAVSAAVSEPPSRDSVFLVRVDVPAQWSADWQGLGQSLRRRFETSRTPEGTDAAVRKARPGARPEPVPAVARGGAASPGEASGAGKPLEEIVLEIPSSDLGDLEEALRSWGTPRLGRVQGPEAAGEPDAVSDRRLIAPGTITVRIRLVPETR